MKGKQYTLEKTHVLQEHISKLTCHLCATPLSSVYHGLQSASNTYMALYQLNLHLGNPSAMEDTYAKTNSWN